MGSLTWNTLSNGWDILELPFQSSLMVLSFFSLVFSTTSIVFLWDPFSWKGSFLSFFLSHLFDHSLGYTKWVSHYWSIPSSRISIGYTHCCCVWHSYGQYLFFQFLRITWLVKVFLFRLHWSWYFHNTLELSLLKCSRSIGREPSSRFLILDVSTTVDVTLQSLTISQVLLSPTFSYLLC